MSETNGSQKATYDSAVRIAQLLLDLRYQPLGLSYQAIQDRLGVSKRTVQRYVEALREKLVVPGGKPLVEVLTQGDRRVVRLATGLESPDGSAWQLYSFLLSLRLGHLLEGTIVDTLNQDLWERIRNGISPEKTKDLDNIDRKLFSLPSMPRDYSQHDELIDGLLRALVLQHRLRIDYAGVLGEGRTHEFDAYSVVEHRGGLYLLGKSHLDKKIIWLAVERIRATEVVRNESGAPLRFAYPADFDPARHTDGMFGVYGGEKMTVRIALANEKTDAFLRSRRIHPTQKFTRGPDGRTHLTMTVRGTHELVNWLLSTSPWVEVLEPAELRDEVAARLRESAAVYAEGRPPARAESGDEGSARTTQRELPLDRRSRSA